MNTKRGFHLNNKQAQFVSERLKAIRDEQRKLQQFLTEEGLAPVGGWREPEEYRLVAGLHTVGKLECDDCDECSVVCWDEPCDCGAVCAGDVVNPENLWVSRVRWPELSVRLPDVKLTRKAGGIRIKLQRNGN